MTTGDERIARLEALGYTVGDPLNP